MPSKNNLKSIYVNKHSFINTNHKIGRPLKRPEEKCSEAVLLKFKNSEIDSIKKEAGLIPLATYLKHKLNF